MITPDDIKKVQDILQELIGSARLLGEGTPNVRIRGKIYKIREDKSGLFEVIDEVKNKDDKTTVIEPDTEEDEKLLCSALFSK